MMEVNLLLMMGWVLAAYFAGVLCGLLAERCWAGDE